MFKWQKWVFGDQRSEKEFKTFVIIKDCFIKHIIFQLQISLLDENPFKKTYYITQKSAVMIMQIIDFGLSQANERRRQNVIPSLIGWAQYLKPHIVIGRWV